MKLPGEKSRHLTYSMNVHPGESWTDVFHAVKQHACAVRDRVAGGGPFGLGLRLSAKAADDLLDDGSLTAFQEFLSDENMYVFTINGFPHGHFHGEPVKASVYEPDWRSKDRLDYTCKLIDILAALLPEGVTGSISTVPVGFRDAMQTPADLDSAADHLSACADYMALAEQRTGKEIHLGLEPEPACYMETIGDFISFFNLKLVRHRSEQAVRRHVGICVDTCHIAVAFESLSEGISWLEREGIRLSKLQISAALEGDVTAGVKAALQAFAEPVYLHQVNMRVSDNRFSSWVDLPDALADWPQEGQKVRVHYHVPLFWEGEGELGSTAHTMDAAFLKAVDAGAAEHLEIETYTWDVLPAVLKSESVDQCIAREYDWVMRRLGAG